MQIDGKRIDLPSFHRPNSKDRAAREHPVSGLRDASENTEHKSADRSCVDVRNLEAESVIQLANVCAARDEGLAGSRLNRLLLILRGIVFVENFSDDLLQQIFHRH